MTNPWRGEVSLTLDGAARRLRLTLGALAKLEAEIGAKAMQDMLERFEGGTFETADLILILRAGLRGGGWECSSRDVAQATIDGGVANAARAAARLLATAFGGGVAA